MNGSVPSTDLGREASARSQAADGSSVLHKLSRRAVKALLRGRYAQLGGATLAARGKRLPEIAAAYTREELAAERGVGPATVREVELWLNARGLCLGSSGEP